LCLTLNETCDAGSVSPSDLADDDSATVMSGFSEVSKSIDSTIVFIRSTYLAELLSSSLNIVIHLISYHFVDSVYSSLSISMDKQINITVL
jgi:hypothetical protein